MVIAIDNDNRVVCSGSKSGRALALNLQVQRTELYLKVCILEQAIWGLYQYHFRGF